tara:strand:- start:461 stop:688 length:228 start_codon:yes stop_codon:yes gene_type:complete
MIKVWLLVILFTSPDLPSIRHMAELTFGEQDCLAKKELRGFFVEDFAMRQGHTIFSYDMHCIETDMFKQVPKENT